VFDDRAAILENLKIRTLNPLWPIFSKTMRPLVEISLAINYAISQYEVWSWHVINSAVHLFAGLVLFGTLRRSFLTQRLRNLFGSQSTWLALSISLIWVVHPIHTQSVTYITQRAEAMMGLFYLLTLYALIRSVDSLTPRIWHFIGVCACVLGMASKPIMVTAPLIVLLYDRTFLSQSFGEALRKRLHFYIGLFLTWALLAWFVQLPPPVEEATAGFGLSVVSPLEYARTQPSIILHYLRLVFWPSPLIIDYDWRIARALPEIVLPTLVILTLLFLTYRALRGRSSIGFLGAWFFVILFPTSSFIPIADLAFEYRMYLPVIAVIALTVIGINRVLGKMLSRQPSLHKRVAVGLVACATIALGSMTMQRNNDYKSELTIWGDTAIKRPGNARAQNNYGYALAQNDQNEQALTFLLKAHDLQPDNEEVHNNLGLALGRLKRDDEAISHYKKALALNPDYANAYSNYGLLLVRLGRHEEALPLYEKAITLEPEFVVAINNLGNALIHLEKYQEAVPYYHQAIKMNPYYAEAYQNLGIALTYLGKLDEAIDSYRKALNLKPRYPDAHSNLGVVFFQKGKLEDAVRHFSAAVSIDSSFKDAAQNLQTILAEHPELEAVAAGR